VASSGVHCSPVFLSFSLAQAGRHCGHVRVRPRRPMTDELVAVAVSALQAASSELYRQLA
jgi:hypothetical protein